MSPPPFKESVSRPRSLKIENGKKEVWQPLMWFNLIEVGFWLFYAKMVVGLGLRVASRFLLDSTRNTSPNPSLQKVLSCKHPCYSWGLGLGTWDPCEVVRPNFCALDSWNWMDWPNGAWDLSLGWWLVQNNL
jgi:hypothetical protein